MVRFCHDGTVGVEGPVSPGYSVERAARLLDSMLPGFDAPPEMRAPGALRIVIARALGTLDLPPYTTVDEFAQALQRFKREDVATAVGALCQSWLAATSRRRAAVEQHVEAGGELTISDIRRARRSTGLTLSDIAERSRIPVSLLRELEWGYFPNWPTDPYGRNQLVRYARAAELDEEVVLRAVWPSMLDGSGRPQPPKVIVGTIVDEAPEEEVATTNVVRLKIQVPELAARSARVERRSLVAAAAIVALIAVGFVPALWHSNDPAPAVEVAAPAVRATAPRQVSTTPPAQPVAAATPRPQQRANPAVHRAAPLTTDVGFSPAFASTGSAMFYHSAASGSNSAIMRADTDGAGGLLRVTRVVNDDAQNYHARPSPGGDMIAFDSDRDGERAVYVARADGQGVRRVTGEGFAAVPSWSPDGRTLAFVRAEADRPRVWNLWTVDLAVGCDDSAHLAPGWAAVGRRLVPRWRTDRLQPRGSSDRSQPRRIRAEDLRLPEERTTGPDPGGLPRRPVRDVPGLSRRRLAAGYG